MKDLRRNWHRRSLKAQKHPGGQDEKKKADSKSTGLTSSNCGLTGAKTGLTGVSSEPGNSSGAKHKRRPSFLLAKYEKEGIAQKQKEKLNEAKDSKPSSKHLEQSDSHSSQGNCTTFNGPIAPWYCYYPYFYTPMDYSRMHMQSYYIQYPPMYSNHTSPRRPIVVNNDLVKKDIDCSKADEKGVKQDSKYLQPRWCSSCLSHSK